MKPFLTGLKASEVALLMALEVLPLTLLLLPASQSVIEASTQMYSQVTS